MRCRLKHGLTQVEAARRIGVSEWTFIGWELGRKEPVDRLWPKVVAFLGYDPTPPAETPGEQFRAARRARGLSMLALAKAVGCDWETVAKWERGAGQPSNDQAARLSAVLTLPLEC